MITTHPKKILIAPGAFKGTLPAEEAAYSIQESLRGLFSHAVFRLCPIADGGDDTLAIVARANPNAIWQSAEVMGPTAGMRMNARYLWLPDQQMIWVEAAQAHGLVLLKGQLAPLEATSYGVGQILKTAIQRHQPHTVIVSLGGSASTDGGVGALQALGFRFLNAEGSALPEPLLPHDFHQIYSMIPPAAEETVHRFLIATDAAIPLLGESGCARVFAPQKGASPEQVEMLNDALAHYADIMKQQLRQDHSPQTGAGAAGGLAYGLSYLPNASIVSGIGIIADLLHLQSHIDWADLIITGEGRLDTTTLQGKGTGHIIKLAKEKPVLFLCGQNQKGLSLLPSVSVVALMDEPECSALALAQPELAINILLKKKFSFIQDLLEVP